MPAMTIRALQNDLKPSIGPVILTIDCPVVLLYDVVEVFVGAQQDVNAGVSLEALNGGGIGTALVDSDLLGYAVQVDGTFLKTPSCSFVPLGSEEKVRCIAYAINYPVQILPLASHFDVGLVHPPTEANWALALAKDCRHRR